MSALRISVPGKDLDWVNLGPACAQSRGAVDGASNYGMPVVAGRLVRPEPDAVSTALREMDTSARRAAAAPEVREPICSSRHEAMRRASRKYRATRKAAAA